MSGAVRLGRHEDERLAVGREARRRRVVADRRQRPGTVERGRGSAAVGDRGVGDDRPIAGDGRRSEGPQLAEVGTPTGSCMS
jgi:hypothetical protein